MRTVLALLLTPLVVVAMLLVTALAILPMAYVVTRASLPTRSTSSTSKDVTSNKP